MRGNRRKKIWLDILILAVTCAWVIAAWYCELPKQAVFVSIILAVLIGGVVLIDIIRQSEEPDDWEAIKEQAAAAFPAHELILLNEEDKPIRAWDLSGKTAMIIGRQNRDEDVDVDLSDCEYSALINIQHAVLNYCLDAWFIEDLGSQNGIQIKKVEDGRCYQVASNRPCKISTGDVIYIAKTKLLFT